MVTWLEHNEQGKLVEVKGAKPPPGVRALEPVDPIDPCRLVPGNPVIRLMNEARAEGVELEAVDRERVRMTGKRPSESTRQRVRRNKDAILKILVLEQRMITGEMKIERLDPADPERETLEDYWLQLEKEYVAACDQEEV